MGSRFTDVAGSLGAPHQCPIVVDLFLFDYA